MANQQPTVWTAEPHTLAKIAILGDYLTRWFAILGSADISRGQDLIYIDGFAGPGEYTNSSQGSPIAALISARKARAEAGINWKAGKIHCVFIEPDQARFEHLTKRVEVFAKDVDIEIHLINKAFSDGFSEFIKNQDGPFRIHFPLFVFLDPFGAKGVPFELVRYILSLGCAEVLVNLDADGIVRNKLAATSVKHEELLDSVFGDDSWKGISDSSFQMKCLEVLQIYKRNLKNRTNYVFSFEMKNSNSSLNYYLVFASRHHLGLKKMKEAMKKVDQDGSFRFVDANVNMIPMFRQDDVEQFARKMAERFDGMIVKYRELEDYSLNETPFLNPKQMLNHLERSGSISVSATANRRQFSFPEEKIESIRFGGE